MKHYELAHTHTHARTQVAAVECRANGQLCVTCDMAGGEVQDRKFGAAITVKFSQSKPCGKSDGV